MGRCFMQEHEDWLRIAREDLSVARALVKGEFFSAVTYHCQQSAEKALKGYLSFKKHEILKSHDLSKLIDLCKKNDRGFDKLYDAADCLNPYATRFRYPTEFGIPDLADSEQAIKNAESILRFVLKKITETTTGQQNMFNRSE
ncbi:MAG: HEPN domain protein [candidate division TM6 bacterium GW2011_GWF2_38_10]|nr:MAG: HEPN domain protein [candidate division TM6 bacterium GW2011_GWF2_38_10]